MANYISITDGTKHARVVDSAFPAWQRFGWGLEPEPEEDEDAVEPESDDEDDDDEDTKPAKPAARRARKP